MHFGELLTKQNLMLTVFLLMIILIVYSFWQAQRDPLNKFNIFDLFMKEGKVMPIQTAFMISFFVSSWVVFDMEVKGQTNPTVFSAYLATWSASLIAKVVFNSKTPSVLPSKEGATNG